jgi:hypothetical protein
MIVGVQEVHEERRQRVGEADRQVDLPADEQEDLAESDDDVRGGVLREQDGQVRAGDKRGAGHREVDEEPDRDDEHGRFPLPEQGTARGSQQPADRAAAGARLLQ